MSVVADRFKVGELVTTSEGEIGVVTKGTHYKKFVGPVINVLIDGKEKSLVPVNITKVEVDDES